MPGNSEKKKRHLEKKGRFGKSSGAKGQNPQKAGRKNAGMLKGTSRWGENGSKNWSRKKRKGEGEKPKKGGFPGL